jgi:hypothetical protein
MRVQVAFILTSSMAAPIILSLLLLILFAAWCSL